MMRRFVIGTILVAAGLAGALGLRAVIDPEEVRAAVERDLSGWSGTSIRLAGRPEVRLLPRPRVLWHDATLTAADGAEPFARIETCEATLSLAALAEGRAAPSALALRRPDLVFDLARLAAAVFPARRPPLDLTVDAGRLRLERGGGPEILFQAVTGRLDWPAAGSTTLDVAARWRDQPVAVRLKAPTTLDGDAPLQLTLTAPGLSLRHEAVLSAAPSLALDGHLSLDLSEPDRFAEWLGASRLTGVLAAPARLDGRLHAGLAGATLSKVALSIGTARATGALSLSRAADATPLLAGTLAFDTIDLAADPAPFGAGWRRIALTPGGPSLDLRVSANRLRAPHVEFERLAATLHVERDHVLAELGEAILWGRTISASATGDIAPTGLTAAVRTTAAELPAAEIGRFLGIDGVESGAVAASFEGGVRCLHLGDCVAAVGGDLRLVGRDLAVTGNSPFGDVTRFHPIVVGPKTMTRRAAWSRADADLHLVGPAAEIRSIDITGDGARFVLRGTSSLADGSVELAGHALFPDFRVDPARSGSSVIRLPIRVHGAIHRLQITPGMPEAAPTPNAAPAPPPLAPAPLPIAPTP